DKVVDQDHLFAGCHTILVHLHLVHPVLQAIGHADGFVRQLAFLADRYEACGKLVRHCSAKDETARLYPGNRVDLLSSMRMHQFVDRSSEGTCIAEKRRDVPEPDPRSRIVRNCPDRFEQRLFKRGCHRKILIAAQFCQCTRPKKERSRRLFQPVRASWLNAQRRPKPSAWSDTSTRQTATGRSRPGTRSSYALQDAARPPTSEMRKRPASTAPPSPASHRHMSPGRPTRA